jgi:hypothetical protein
MVAEHSEEKVQGFAWRLGLIYACDIFHDSKSLPRVEFFRILENSTKKIGYVLGPEPEIISMLCYLS